MSEIMFYELLVTNYFLISLAFYSQYSSLQKMNNLAVTSLGLKSPKKRKELEQETQNLRRKKRLFLLWPVVLLINLKDEFSNK